jgi:TolB-like protein
MKLKYMQVRLNKKVIAFLIICNVLFSQGKTVAVLPFDAAGISSEEASILSDRLSSEIYKTGAFIVVERSKMEEVLNEQGFQQSGCVSSECAVEVGAMLGVQSMVVGSVGKFGSLFTVSVRLVDVGSGEVKAQVSKDISGSIETLLLKTMKEIAAELSGKKITQPIVIPEKKPENAFIQILSSPSSAYILLNGDTLGVSPFRERFSRGTYVFTITKPGYKSSQLQVLHKNVDVSKVKTLYPPRGSIGLSFKGSTNTAYDKIKDRSISIDGVVYGKNAVWRSAGKGRVELTKQSFKVGSHKIQIKRHGYDDFTTSVNVVDDQTSFAIVSQKRIMVPVNISLTPNKQEVVVNGLKANVKGLTLPFGKHTISSTASKYEKFSKTINVINTNPIPLTIKLVPKSKSKAISFSTVFPGYGQYYSENKTKSLLFMAAGVGLSTLLAIKYNEYSAEDGLIQEYHQNYNNAESTTEIETTWNTYDSQVSKVNDLNTQLAIYGGTLVVVWIANIIDSFLFSGLSDD